MGICRYRFTMGRGRNSLQRSISQLKLPCGLMLLFALLCAGLLAGCGPAPEPDSHEYTLIALGTLVNIELVTADEPLARQARDELQILFADFQRDWYAFGDGELGRVNAVLATGGSTQTTPELAALIERSLAYRAMSDGHFDPVIGNLVELWGFANFDTATRAPTPPPGSAIDAWSNTRSSLPGVSVSDQTIHATAPVKIDLGGVAKGTVLAHAMTLVKRLGIDAAMIDAGGDLQVLGSRGERPWRVGIRNPHRDGIIATVELQAGEAIVTSGNYERYFDHDGQRYQHVLNPQTGRPVDSTAGVTIIHPDPELADAAATALMVAGPQRFAEIAERMGISTALIIDTGGELRMTPAMTRRLTMRQTQ